MEGKLDSPPCILDTVIHAGMTAVSTALGGGCKISIFPIVKQA